MRLLLICLGGAAGTAARYAINLAAASWPGLDFPLGTLRVRHFYHLRTRGAT